MSDPNIDRLKNEERIKIDVPEEEIPFEEEAYRSAKGTTADLAEEFKRLGRQFADTLESAFNSQEARRIESELRAGMRSFADEVERAFHEVKDSPAATRVKEETVTVKERVETGEMGRKAQEGLVSGLRWLSDELEKMANQFTPAARSEQPPAEKSPTE